jgi:hypothetical protein
MAYKIDGCDSGSTKAARYVRTAVGSSPTSTKYTVGKYVRTIDVGIRKGGAVRPSTGQLYPRGK